MKIKKESYKKVFDICGEQDRIRFMVIYIRKTKTKYLKNEMIRRGYRPYKRIKLSRYKRFIEARRSKFKKNPWVLSKVNKRSLYKCIFVREYLRNRNQRRERKNKIYMLAWKKYAAIKKIPTKRIAGSKGKRRTQIQPTIRKYIYLPYYGHVSVKSFIKINKELRKDKKNKPCFNKTINHIELNILNFLTKNNFSIVKKNAVFLIKNKTILLHNTNSNAYLQKKELQYEGAWKAFIKNFRWENNFFLLENQLYPYQKYNLQNKNVVSINADYKNKNWFHYMSLQKKKYLTKNFQKNKKKNLVYIKNYITNNDILNNDRMSSKYWAAISFLKNKIRYNTH